MLLVRFTKQAIIKRPKGSGWFSEGQGILAWVDRKRDGKFAVLDTPEGQAVVGANTFIIENKLDIWEKPVPQRCEVCAKEIQGVFWWSKVKHGDWVTACNICHATYCLTAFFKRYEQDPSNGMWVNTAPQYQEKKKESHE